MLFHATYSKQRYFYISKLKHITPPHTTKYIFLSCFFFSLFCFQLFSFIFCVHFMIFVHCIQFTIYNICNVFTFLFAFYPIYLKKRMNCLWKNTFPLKCWLQIATMQKMFYQLIGNLNILNVAKFHLRNTL